jgi:Fic family protein
MKVPKLPPDHERHFSAMVSNALKQGEDAIGALAVQATQAQPVDEQGRYLSWDEFRFRADGADVTDRWALMRRERASRAIALPFHDKTGRAFSFVKIDKVERALHDIDSRARGAFQTEKAVINDREANSYLITSLIEEPFSSSVFEGAVATRDQAKALINEGRKPKTVSDRMVLNNYRAMEFIKSRRTDPLTPALVLELHRIITDGTLDDPAKAGVLRDATDKIVVESQQDGEILHDPPPASELASRLERLCAFANGGAEDVPFIHPIIRAIALHFMLAYDHPFIDGNGRTARALFYWAVLRHGYWLLEYVSISMQIIEAPIQYGRALLDTETDGSDLTYFIDQQVGVIQKATDALFVYIERKRREIAEVDKTLNALRAQFNHRQIALITRAMRGGLSTITIANHERMTGVSYLTARSDLERLAESGLFIKQKRGVTSFYRPAPNLREKHKVT